MPPIPLVATVTPNCKGVNVKLHTRPGRLVANATRKTEDAAREAAVKQAKRTLKGFEIQVRQ